MNAIEQVQLTLQIPNLSRHLRRNESLLGKGLSVGQTLERCAVKTVLDEKTQTIYLHSVVYYGLVFSSVTIRTAQQQITIEYIPAPFDQCESLIRKLTRADIPFKPLQKIFLGENTERKQP